MISELDIYVLLKLCALGPRTLGQGKLAAEIGVSPSSVNSSLKQLNLARLYNPEESRPRKRAVLEACLHGARYFLPVKWGTASVGVPTAWASSAYEGKLLVSGALPPVWPSIDGGVKGIALEPLHPSAPAASATDPTFYKLLSLFDSIRSGSAREVEMAKKLFQS